MADQTDGLNPAGGIDFTNTNVIFGPGQMNPFMDMNIMAASSQQQNVTVTVARTNILSLPMLLTDIEANNKFELTALLNFKSAAVDTVFDVWLVLDSIDIFHATYTVLGGGLDMEELIKWQIVCRAIPGPQHYCQFTSFLLGQQVVPVDITTAMVESGAALGPIITADTRLEIDVQMDIASAVDRIRRDYYCLELIKGV